MKHSFKKSLAIILTSLALALSAIGVTPVYAAGPWYVAPGGGDGNSCLSVDSPCATINGAIGKATDGDTIEVATGTYTGNGTEVVLINKNITLSGGWDAGFTTQAGMSTVDGQAARGGVKINTFVTTTIERFVLQNGSSSSGIYNDSGTLTLNNSIVSGNSAYYGGGIYSHMGTITLNNSTVSGNTIHNSGGGIQNDFGTLTLNNSTVSDNTGSFGSSGGGIYNQFGTLTLNNSTVSGNSAWYGGGIYSSSPYGTVTLNNSTISDNSAGTYGGGIYNEEYQEGVITLENTLLAGNSTTSITSGPDCYGSSIGSAGYNLIGNNSGCAFSASTGDQVGTSTSQINPLLSPLQDNGGPTFTQALLGSSPALNAGNPAVPGSGGTSCLATDQRGVARPDGGRCDIGAYEGNPTIPGTILPTGKISDPTPTYKWSKIPEATNYQYQLVKGATTVYTKSIAASACGPTTCSNTPTNSLVNAVYNWRVQAMIAGVWMDYGAYQTFIVAVPKAGFWSSRGTEFFVTPNHTKIDNYAIYINVPACGIYNRKLVYTPLVSIVNNGFTHKGAFYFSGTFNSSALSNGSAGLKHYYIPNCGYVNGGPFAVTAKWKNSKQPSSADAEEFTMTVVASDATPFLFDIETVTVNP